MSDAVQVRGADELTRSLGAAAGALEDLTDVNDEAGRYVLARSRSAAPRKSGRLAGSLKATSDKTTTSVESDLVYAAPIHWGWEARNIEAQPFIVDTLASVEPAVVEIYQRNNERILSNVRGI